MATATIDGLEVIDVMRGSGPALLMLAPGGFDATLEKWTFYLRDLLAAGVLAHHAARSDARSCPRPDPRVRPCPQVAAARRPQ